MLDFELSEEQLFWCQNFLQFELLSQTVVNDIDFERYAKFRVSEKIANGNKTTLANSADNFDSNEKPVQAL